MDMTSSFLGVALHTYRLILCVRESGWYLADFLFSKHCPAGIRGLFRQ